ncbi:hypothetical protein [Dyadobacter sp. CY323]|uniref:hypothetical protein n=1 Tax=Dyadobacter sp. CY323 TaxID=2907302 RepID=UPI001F30CD3E|nr:hypothetical protein [Dyadobacter sp. CY323]MCE6987944.1 hypothetical protein [Dyadobacter sp. CY323]
MNTTKTFKSKDDETVTYHFSLDEVEDIIPDADMRFSLVILKSGEKHFVWGLEKEIWDELKS